MKTSRLVAVIDIGSTAIRLVVAEINSSAEWRIIDRAGKPVPLGRNVFGTGKIGRDAMAQSLSILSGFQEVVRSYHIDEADVTVIATSALREARNRDRDK